MFNQLNIDYCNPGSSCWAAFLKDGALRENSPNHLACVILNAPKTFVYIFLICNY